MAIRYLKQATSGGGGVGGGGSKEERETDRGVRRWKGGGNSMSMTMI